MFPSAALNAKKQKFSENANFISRWHQFPSRSSHKLESAYDSNINITYPWDSCDDYNEANPSIECESQSKPSSPLASTIAQHQLTSLSDRLEEKWYRSPEELGGGGCTTSSNIYCLGVLIFEVRLLLHLPLEIFMWAFIFIASPKLQPDIFVTIGVEHSDYKI